MDKTRIIRQVLTILLTSVAAGCDTGTAPRMDITPDVRDVITDAAMPNAEDVGPDKTEILAELPLEEVTNDAAPGDVDDVPPDTSITSHPGIVTNQTEASFEFECNEPGCTFKCRLGAGQWENCTSTRTYTELTAGIYTFYVKAADAEGNEDKTSAAYSWTIDLTEPDTTITAIPHLGTEVLSATFAFVCNETGCSFECHVDSEDWETCASPKAYSDLTEGSHIFSVRAIDRAGNVDTTPASYSWTIDLTKPETTITLSPPSYTNATQASFMYECSEPDCTFECKLDSTAFSFCSSSKTYIGLSTGEHTFLVRATDSMGNTDDSPASYTWTVDTIAPDTEITSASKPANPTGNTMATFEFSCSDATCAYQCRLDIGDYEPCTSPKEYTGLADGNHAFFVKASDAAGNSDLTPASHVWVVDTNAPDTLIISKPANQTNDTGARFEFWCSEAACTYQCKLDDGGYQACTSPKTYSDLGTGTHTFHVKAKDIVGNEDSTEASYSWMIDVIPPIKSSAKDITAFSVVDVAGTIAGNNITVTVPPGTVVTALVPTIEVSVGASVSPGSGVAQDFTSPTVLYTVTAEDGSTRYYMVTVKASDAKEITAFSILGNAGVITGTDIVVTMPYGTRTSGYIGNTGPAGGLIFYDKGFVSDGWRYLEAAPSDQSTGQAWSNITDTLVGTGTAIGTGQANTVAIIAQANHTDSAAKLCNDLEVGSYSDWFLPSMGELNQMYVNLAANGIGDFGYGSNYWSSSEDDGGTATAWLQEFDNGYQYNGDKSASVYVRCVRAVTDVTDLTPSITDLTPAIDVSVGASVSPASGESQDFTHPVIYIVAAADGSIKMYTVTVTIAKNDAKDITGFVLAGVNSEVEISGTDIAATIQYGTTDLHLTPTITVSTEASVNPASGVARDFTTPQTYTVTAANGSTKTYTVIVTVRTSYILRDTGPAGGLIFYINSNYLADGWEYLEAAPSDQSTSTEWGCCGAPISGADGVTIGTGKQNTIDILLGCSTANIAVRLCDDLTLNDHSDWFLPSKDELNKMRTELYLHGVGGFGGFGSNGYWSSSEYNNFYNDGAWALGFNAGTADGGLNRSSIIHVRCAVAF